MVAWWSGFGRKCWFGHRDFAPQGIYSMFLTECLKRAEKAWKGALQTRGRNELLKHPKVDVCRSARKAHWRSIFFIDKWFKTVQFLFKSLPKNIKKPWLFGEKWFWNHGDGTMARPPSHDLAARSHPMSPGWTPKSPFFLGGGWLIPSRYYNPNLTLPIKL